MTKTIGPKEAALKELRKGKTAAATKMVKLATAVAAINASSDKAIAKANAAEPVLVANGGGADDAIPPFLDRKTNGVKPASADPKPEAAAPVAAARPFDPYAEQHAELKREKAKGRIAKMKAKQSGDAAKMPLTGKAALAVIKQKPEHDAKADSKESDVRTKTKTTSKSNARTPVKDKGTKLGKIGELLARKEGCTTADVLKATGWPAVSMPASAKALGIKLKKEKKPGDATRYYAA